MEGVGHPKNWLQPYVFYRELKEEKKPKLIRSASPLQNGLASPLIKAILLTTLSFDYPPRTQRMFFLRETFFEGT
jgi:hypothetical protein